jgi:hypothetical protein
MPYCGEVLENCVNFNTQITHHSCDVHELNDPGYQLTWGVPLRPLVPDMKPPAIGSTDVGCYCES